jgi:hypothetical protein
VPRFPLSLTVNTSFGPPFQRAKVQLNPRNPTWLTPALRKRPYFTSNGLYGKSVRTYSLVTTFTTVNVHVLTMMYNNLYRYGYLYRSRDIALGSCGTCMRLYEFHERR